jgi:hypothetical protein
MQRLHEIATHRHGVVSESAKALAPCIAAQETLDGRSFRFPDHDTVAGTAS